MERNLCPFCRKHPVAINYYRKGKTYFRTACTPCIHGRNRSPTKLPGWVKSGYRKPDKCDRCAFKFKINTQAKVYYVDGNTNNNHWANLRTICLNCQIEISHMGWRPSPIQPDF